MIVEMLQFFLALAEIGVCFWACDKLIYHGEVVGRHRWCIIICTFIISGFVVWNRAITFASFLVLLAGVAMIWGLIYAYTRKKALLSFMFILDYLLLTSLLDLALSFFAISILGEGYWNKIYYSASLGRIIIYVISRAIMITSCYILQYYAKKLNFDIDSYRGALFGLGTVGGIWWWWLLTTLLDRGGANSLGDSFFVITCLVILLTLMAIELKSIYLKSQAQMIQMKNELLEKNYDNFYGLYENSRYVYHDFKNHMILLKNYMEQNEYDKAQQYLENIVTPLEELSNYTFCDSQVLNLVLNVKGYEANQKGVRFWADIEACDKIENKEKWIHVAIKKKKQVMVIKIENSIEKQIIMKDGKYVTEKHNKAIHGLGLQSVKSLVEKYDGEVHCSHTEDIFTVVITFFENGL